MKPIIALIDAIMVVKGKKALRDMERFSRDPRKANEATLFHDGSRFTFSVRLANR